MPPNVSDDAKPRAGLPDEVSAWDVGASASYGGPATDPESPPMVSFALAYSTSGLFLFPAHGPSRSGRCSCDRADCNRVGKHPIGELVPRGLHDATTDPATIGRWWAVWPDANIAIRTGRDSGVIVLDVDESGWESIGALEDVHGPLPDSWIVATGGGGAHLYLRHPGGRVPNSRGTIAPGIDVRGDGGYVIAPPSQHHSGNRYKWADGYDFRHAPLTDAPPWLLARFAPVGDTSTRPSPKLAADEQIPEGARNDRLMRLGAAFRSYGFTEAEILAGLLAVNEARCHPPLPAAEVEKISASVARYTPATSNGTLRVAGVELPAPRGRRRP
jgi:Bifunctional DNA primase/polymerase, N-terminal/Primase C terminal 1 (PriCT-1)